MAPAPADLPSPDAAAPGAGARPLALALGGAGLLWTAAAVLDPAARLPALPGLAAALAGAAWVFRRGPAAHRPLSAFLALLAAVYAVDAQVTPNLGADSRSYLVFLPSLLRGQGVDFAEVFAEWGVHGLSRDSWLLRGTHPVGPALVWAPFFLLAHAWVLAGQALGREAYAADFLAAPYVRAAVLGTGCVAVAGLFALFAVLRARHAHAVALLATALAALATIVPFYVVVQPAMAHGVVFGAACVFLWAWTAAAREPTRRSWTVLGAAFGALVLMRWQAAVAGVLPAALALRDLQRGRLDPRHLAWSAGAALLAFAPQLLAWKAQYGRWLVHPQGAGYVDWTSPHLLDVLLSADRGLFAWTPVALVGVAGLVSALRRETLLAGGSLAVLLLTAWVNGGVRDWTGNDAFGARRFDLAVPLLAVGLGVAVEAATRLVARRPVLAPAALGAALAAWNLGLVHMHARNTFPDGPAPLERVATGQAGLLRRSAEAGLGALFGARGRDLAHRFFVGEYFYVNTNLGGTLHVGGDDERWLGEGWSRPRWHDSGQRFRWALYPQACLRIPLAGPASLQAVLTARVPRRLGEQAFTVVVNGTAVGGGRLGPEWSDTPFLLPASALVAGVNEVCFRFSRPWGEEGQQVGAQVARLQLP